MSAARLVDLRIVCSNKQPLCSHETRATQRMNYLEDRANRASAVSGTSALALFGEIMFLSHLGLSAHRWDPWEQRGCFAKSWLLSFTLSLSGSYSFTISLPPPLFSHAFLQNYLFTIIQRIHHSEMKWEYFIKYNLISDFELILNWESKRDSEL